MKRKLNCYSTIGHYTDADTIIYDGQGWAHDGYLCVCPGCPYMVGDCEGNSACYGDMYHKCKGDDNDED